MSAQDSFIDLARFYDGIMRHVDYDRWYLIADAIAGLLPRSFTHLDVACGTGVLLRKLLHDRWNSTGVDLSISMLRAGRNHQSRWPVAAGDIRALPFAGSFNYVTCLFDSLNFLLTDDDMSAGVRAMADCLTPDGVLYFDIVTERMVLDHFAGQRWTEKDGKLSTRWRCDYDRVTQVVETRIQVNRGDEYTLYERVYDQCQVEEAIRLAGIEVLGAFDAETWGKPRKRTVRIDFVGVKGDAEPLRSGFKSIQKHVRSLLK